MRLLAVLAISLFTASSFAAPRKKGLPKKLPEKKAVTTERTVEINVPQMSYQTEKPAENARSSEMAFQISSWVPSDIKIESRIPASKFNAKLPQLSGHVLIPVARPSWAAILLRAGLGYQSFERTGSIDLSTFVHDEKQNAHMLSGALGLVIEPDIVNGRMFSAMADLKAVPSYLMVERSAMSRESSHFGVGYEIGAGVSAHLQRILGDAADEDAGSDWRVDLSAGRAFGSSSAVDYDGYNVRAGLRWSLN